MQMLEHAVRDTGGIEGCAEAFGAQRRLMRMLEDHRIAGNQGRQHGIDGGEVGIIPGRHHRDDAERNPLDPALEAGLGRGHHGGERFRGRLEHVARAFLEAAHLARRVANGAAHLPGDFGGNVGGLGDEGIDGLAQGLAACIQRQGRPGRLRRAGHFKRAIDARRGLERAFDVNAAVDGTNGLQCLAHLLQMISK